jgi:predicted homoserine dehydrogenase-like protein
MIIVDTALSRRAQSGKPLRVGVVGAGYVSRGITSQMVRNMPGVRVAAISNRTLSNAERAYRGAGVDDFEVVNSVGALEDRIGAGRYSIVEDPLLLCRAAGIEVVIEATGQVEFGAGVAVDALRHGKHLVLVNAELDGTVGPILKVYADRAGVIATGCNGDQPGVQMDLYRYLVSMGLEPLVCGNIKGLMDHYRNPDTQVSFARQWGYTPAVAASFADGTKISFEQALVANATGMRVAKRGMLGYEHKGHIDSFIDRFDVEQLREWGGIVDYALGAQPGPGIFIFAACNDDIQKLNLDLMKMGNGPLYSFYVPYHVSIMEIPFSAARAALLHDATIAPKGPIVVEVVATAKKDLHAGERIDCLGGFATYSQCENADVARDERLLPMGIAEGCRLKRDVKRDAVLTYDDVEIPAGRTVDRLRAEQDAHFAPNMRTQAAQ